MYYCPRRGGGLHVAVDRYHRVMWILPKQCRVSLICSCFSFCDFFVKTESSTESAIQRRSSLVSEEELEVSEYVVMSQFDSAESTSC